MADRALNGRPNITLRPITANDEEFLYHLYAGTREAEMATVDWNAAEKEAFLKMQFAAQHKYYTEQFTGAGFDLIMLDGEPIGRLYIDRRPDEIRIIDIALLPAHRNQGIGTGFLTNIQKEAAAADLPVRIHVERYNPALKLYDRLGFRAAGDNGVYRLMEWSPGSSYQMIR